MKTPKALVLGAMLAGCSTQIYGWHPGTGAVASPEALAESHARCVHELNRPIWRKKAADVVGALFIPPGIERPMTYKNCMERAGWVKVNERISPVEFKRLPEFGAEYVP